MTRRSRRQVALSRRRRSFNPRPEEVRDPLPLGRGRRPVVVDAPRRRRGDASGENCQYANRAFAHVAWCVGRPSAFCRLLHGQDWLRAHGVPPPRPIAVAMRRPITWPTLSALGAGHSDTSSSIISAAIVLTASRITSACSSSPSDPDLHHATGRDPVTMRPAAPATATGRRSRHRSEAPAQARATTRKLPSEASAAPSMKPPLRTTSSRYSTIGSVTTSPTATAGMPGGYRGDPLGAHASWSVARLDDLRGGEERVPGEAAPSRCATARGWAATAPACPRRARPARPPGRATRGPGDPPPPRPGRT